MKIGKSLAASAVSGILLGVLAGCGGGDKPAASPATDNAAPGAKGSCGGKGSCSGKGSCGGSAAPAGSGETKQSCSGKMEAPKTN